jgi:hypothetical protein
LGGVYPINHIAKRAPSRHDDAAFGPQRMAMEPKAKEGQSLEIDAVTSFE